MAAEKAAEKEEEKRRQKIADWENLSSMGMGAGRDPIQLNFNWTFNRIFNRSQDTL